MFASLPRRITRTAVAASLILGTVAALSTHVAADATTARTGYATAPAMPTTAPTGYTRVFSEDFTRSAPLGTFEQRYTDFDQYSGCCSTNGSTHYDASKVLSVSGGSLYYHLHSEDGVSYAAAPVPAHYYNFRYGQVGTSVRLVSGGPGYKMAFLMWPGSGQWTNEIDFPEVEPYLSGGSLYAASLNATTADGGHVFAGGGGDNNPSKVTLADHRFHTFLLDWQPGKITATIDGVTYWTFTGSAVPSVLMHFVMQTEGWLHQGPVPASDSALLQVPYVYINTWNGSSTATARATGGASSAPTHVARHVTIAAPRTVAARRQVTLTGSVSRPGGRVALQLRKGGRWIGVGRTYASGSRYRAIVTGPAMHRANAYRVIVSASGRLTRAVSRTVTVRAR